MLSSPRDNEGGTLVYWRQTPSPAPPTISGTAAGQTTTSETPVKPFSAPEFIAAEREGFRRAARQTSMLDLELEALEPVPYAFAFTYEDGTGPHTMRCGDWETSATFWYWSKSYGEQGALDRLTKTFGEDYPSKGMVFAMGTLKKRPKQWILLGVIRLDETTQASFAF